MPGGSSEFSPDYEEYSQFDAQSLLSSYEKNDNVIDEATAHALTELANFRFFSSTLLSFSLSELVETILPSKMDLLVEDLNISLFDLARIIIAPVPIQEIISTPAAPQVQTPEHSPKIYSIEFWKKHLTLGSVKHLIAGGFAGAVSRTVVSPLERMKILFQVQGPEPAAYNGMLPTLIKMWKEEGFMGLLRGNGTNVIRIVPYSAIQFAAYEQFKRMLMETGKTELDTPRRLTAGALAGICSVTATYTLDITRTRLSVQSASVGTQAGGNKKLPGIWATMKIIYRTENGLFGLYRGLVPTLLGVAPYVALNFQCYETLKKYFTPSDAQPSIPKKLAAGALAGSIAQTITYPLDVLRRRMQVTGMNSIAYKYNGTWDAASQIIKHEGVRGLYKGLLPNYAKVAPAIATSFVVYEETVKLLSKYENPSL